METPWSVLIIDDSQTDCAIYQRFLATDPQHSYTFAEANSAEDGLTLCQRGFFDVVLLDFQLPDLSGLEILQGLKTHVPQAAIVMLTAYGDEGVAVTAMKSGALDYLVKDGLTPQVLQRTVRNVVYQAQLQRQLQQRREQQRLLTHIAFRVRQSLQLTETLATVVTEVRQLLQSDRVLVYQFATDMTGEIIAESVASRWPPALGQTVQDTYFQTGGADAYRHGRTQIVTNVETADLDACHRQLLTQFDVKAILVVPILINREEQPLNDLWGLLVVHQCSKPRQWQTSEIQMVDELSVHIAIAIQHAELLAQTQAALEQEKALTTFKSKIVAMVSHEYNAPLTAIHAAAATLRTHWQELAPETQARFLSIIEEKSMHLSSLVSDMLVVNQAELNQLQFHPAVIQLETFISRLVAEQQQLLAEQYDLIFKTRGDFTKFVGDRGLLQQVVVNLLSNAIKYSQPGSKVWINLIGEKTQVICQVCDEGIGIMPQDQQNLFEPFSRGSNIGNIAGTGLGLHIAKIAVELHGGKIAVESREGQGSCFTVQIPKQIWSATT